MVKEGNTYTEDENIQEEYEERKSRIKKAIVAVAILGLLFAFFEFYTPHKPGNLNNSTPTNTTNTSIVTTPVVSNSLGEFIYSSKLTPLSCQAKVLNGYLLSEQIVVPIPNFSYTVKVYSIDGNPVQFVTNINPYNNTLLIKITPTRPVRSPFVYIFFNGPNKVMYSVCESPNVHTYNVSFNGVQVLNTTREEINLLVNFTIKGPDATSIKLLPMFPEIVKSILKNRINASIYYYWRDYRNGLYKLKFASYYTISRITYYGDRMIVTLGLSSYLPVSIDNIYLLKISFNGRSILNKLVRIGTATHIVTIIPVNYTNNTLEFLILNPENATINSVNVFVIYSNTSTFTTTLNKLPKSGEFSVKIPNAEKVTLVSLLISSEDKTTIERYVLRLS